MKEEKQKSQMNKIIVVSLILIALLFAGWKLTGNVVSNGNGVVDVIRSPVTNDPYFFIKNVLLTVSSSENVLAIEEGFIGVNCSVIQYEVNPEMDIVQFNPDLNLWVIGNRSSKLIFNLSYSIPDNCVVNLSAGMVYTIKGNQTGTVVGPVSQNNSNVSAGGNTGATGNIGGSSGGGNTGGSSGGGNTGGSSGTTVVIPVSMNSVPIVQAKDDADLKNLIKTANDKLAAFTDESGGKSDSFYVYVIIGIILVFIIGFVALIAVTKPREPDFSNMNIQKFRQELAN